MSENTTSFENAEIYSLGSKIKTISRSSIIFHQRVYSESQGWCYYKTESAPDPSPSTTATSPVHTGNISDAQVLNVVGIPER